MTKTKKPITVSISSGKGGVGKTSCTINLAFAISQKGPRVLIVDGDLGLANVDVMLRLSVKTTIRDILETGLDPLEAVIYLDTNLGVLPASSGVPEMITLGPEEQARMEKFLTSVSGHFDFVMIDTAAGIGPSVLWFNKFADRNIILLTPDPASLTDAYALIKILSHNYNMNGFNAVLNRIGSEEEARRTYQTLENASKQFLSVETHFLGAIPEDKTVRQAVLEQQPYIKQNPKGKASRAIFNLAEQVQLMKN
jgi:flagellar biosynthesis protein FlhG